VQRTEQILKLLMQQQVLTQDQRELIWNATTFNDGELRVELFKILTGAAAEMRS
jgi:uncharacterized protein Smg (DUF494 family)